MKHRHTGIVIEDLEKAIYFYRDLLGLKFISEENESGEFLDGLLGIKDVKLTVVKLEGVELLKFHTESFKGERATNRHGFTHIAFTVEEDIYEKLLKAGVEFNAPPRESGDVKVAYCKDFEGNFIELIWTLN